MAWELRRGRPYYYRKERHGDRVVSRYAGGGPAGHSSACRDREERAARARSAEARRSDRDRLADENQAMEAWFEDVEVLAQAALLAAGYYRHDRGEWRKRRESTQG
jgi:hypothetical protein